MDPFFHVGTPHDFGLADFGRESSRETRIERVRPMLSVGFAYRIGTRHFFETGRPSSTCKPAKRTAKLGKSHSVQTAAGQRPLACTTWAYPIQIRLEGMIDMHVAVDAMRVFAPAS
jgi:hypothetical protein